MSSRTGFMGTLGRPVNAFFGAFNRGFNWLSSRYGMLTAPA